VPRICGLEGEIGDVQFPVGEADYLSDRRKVAEYDGFEVWEFRRP
jgi:hypothetical protein